jgi:hypothetical protein
MYDLRKEFGTDQGKESSGVWIDLKNGARLRVARWGNIAFRELLRRKTRKHGTAIQKNALPEAISERILIEVIANTILLDWSGIFDAGQALPYTVENAIRVLSELKDFRDLVISIAENAEYFKAEEDEEIAKNSQPASHGS